MGNSIRTRPGAGFAGSMVAGVAVTAAVLLATAGCGDGGGGGSAPSAAPSPGLAAPGSAPLSSGPTVIDQPSGVTVRLGGPAVARTSPVPGTGQAVRTYTVDLRNAQLQQRLNITDLPAPITNAVGFTPQIARGIPAHVSVTSNNPITVNGHPGADFRFDIIGLAGTHRGVMFGRAVYTRTRSVQALTLVLDPTGTDVQDAQRLHTQTLDTLVVP